MEQRLSILIILSTLLTLLLVSPAIAWKIPSEAFYQEVWCAQQQGIEEYTLPDRTRVDCLTDEYAVELDFAQNWYNGIGQSLHYAKETGRLAGLVLIMRSKKDLKFVTRTRALLNFYNLPIRLWVIGD